MPQMERTTERRKALLTADIHTHILEDAGIHLPPGEHPGRWWRVANQSAVHYSNADDGSDVTVFVNPNGTRYTLSVLTTTEKDIVIANYAMNGALYGIQIAADRGFFPNPEVREEGTQLPAQYGAYTDLQQYHQIMRAYDFPAIQHLNPRSARNTLGTMLHIQDLRRMIKPEERFHFQHGPYTYDERTKADLGLSVVHDRDTVYVGQKRNNDQLFSYSFPANLEVVS